MKITPIKNSSFSKYQVTYFFNHSKMGFSNSVTVEALSIDHAIENAKQAVKDCYGSKMLPRFTFKTN